MRAVAVLFFEHRRSSFANGAANLLAPARKQALKMLISETKVFSRNTDVKSLTALSEKQHCMDSTHAR